MRFESISTSLTLSSSVWLQWADVMIALTALANNKYIALHSCIIFTFGYLFHQAHPNWICNCFQPPVEARMNEHAWVFFVCVRISSASLFFSTSSMLHFISSSTCECDEFSSFLFFVPFNSQKRRKTNERTIIFAIDREQLVYRSMLYSDDSLHYSDVQCSTSNRF